jgi:hypothetical protein
MLAPRGLFLFARRKGNAVRLTIDSSEPLEDAMRVLGALYGVRLAVAGDNGADDTAAEASSTRTGRRASARTATPKSATRRRAELLAVPTSAPEASKTSAPARRKRASRGRRSAASATNAEIRAWARDHGMSVSGRGRIPGAVMTAYREARAR